MGLTMTDREHEITRLVANVTDEQRAWLERWMFWGWPESFVQARLLMHFKLDGTDDVPDEEFWWSAFAYFYQKITGQEPPGLVRIEPAPAPSDSVHFN